MQITPKIINIPPYLSTTWDNIISLKTQVEENLYILFVTLKTGESVKVPHLDKAAIDAIFKAHAEHVEHPADEIPRFPLPFTFSLPLNKAEGPITSLGNAMHHNPNQADLPDMPAEMLEKIALVAKAFGLDDASSLPPPEENCNCINCQITRALAGESRSEAKEIAVSDEELRFRDWDIKQTADKLYIVTSPFDANEQYNVYLGEPIGCTCGQKNCEHIKAVLHS